MGHELSSAAAALSAAQRQSIDASVVTDSDNFMRHLQCEETVFQHRSLCPVMQPWVRIRAETQRAFYCTKVYVPRVARPPRDKPASFRARQYQGKQGEGNH